MRPSELALLIAITRLLIRKYPEETEIAEALGRLSVRPFTSAELADLEDGVPGL